MKEIKILNGTPKYFSLMEKKEIGKDDFLYLALLYQYIGCPHACLKCFNDDDVPAKTFNPNYLSLQERKSLINEAKNLGGKVIVFTGLAEPLMHKDSKSLIEYTAQKGMIPIVYSNGFELDSDMVSFLKDNNVVVAISFDSLDPHRFWMMTKPKSKISPIDYHKKILGNIENCIDVYKNTITNERGVKMVNTAIITTLCKTNEDEIEEIKSYFGDDTYFVCNPLAYEGGAIKNWPILMGNLRPNSDSHMQIIKKCSESGGPLTLFNGTCGYSNHGLAIYPDGTYATCAYTSKTNGLLGKVGCLGLKEAWENKHKNESSYYKEFGNVSCLIRDEKFGQYVDKLKIQ